MDTHSPHGETVLPDTLHELAERVGRRALVLIFSDLFTDTAELKNALRHLHFRKHDVAVFHLVDQLEIDFDFDRPIRFVDMEGGGSLITEPDLIADEYRAIVASYLERNAPDLHGYQCSLPPGRNRRFPGRRADRLPDGTSEKEGGRINARLSHGTVDCSAERMQDAPRRSPDCRKRLFFISFPFFHCGCTR